MNNLSLLFDNNDTKVYKVSFNPNRKTIDISYRVGRIDGDAISTLTGILKCVVDKYGHIHPTIFLDFGKVEFADKLTYIVLECILLSLIQEYRFDVIVNLYGENRITASGWTNSPIISLASSSREERKNFAKRFKFILNRNHFRRLIVEKGDNVAASKAYDDLCDFIKYSEFQLDSEIVDEITEVIAELISNGLEHGENECLLDVDIAGGFYDTRTQKSDTEYLGLSVAVVNLSKKLMGEGLHRKMESNIRDSLPQRYKSISQALQNHSTSFDDNYNEEDFYNIAIFQNHISGRYDISEAGGTGMVKLVKALSDQAVGDNCYFLTGRRVVFFRRELLEYNDEGWIGFNSRNDFFNETPDEGVINSCSFYFPGVAYNLQFIMERT